MARIKPLASIADKWKEVTPGRSKYYEEGVKGKGDVWKEGASKANDAWKDGVDAAAREDRFRKGVEKPDAANKYEERATRVGPARWRDGVSIAADDFRKGYEPYHRAYEATTLPPRGMKGDPKNIDRVRHIADLFHKLKVGA